MSDSVPLSLFASLGEVPDPRRERPKLHQLVEILVIAVGATICAAETWEEIEEFGRAKESWFKKFLAVPNGIASHDTFRRVFLRINPKKFQEAFVGWVRGVAQLTAGEVVAIDGKQVRGARTADGKEGLRMVSAWASAPRRVLGQLKTEEKSNEITAIPLLLEWLELKGCIVTIDAMGCQTEIAAQVIAQEADYVLSLKGNQGPLDEEVEEYFAWAEKLDFKDLEYDYCATLEKDHGRLEGRRCWVTEDTDWFTEKAEWAGLREKWWGKRRRLSADIASAAYQPMPNKRCARYVGLGRWRTLCTGSWMSLFVKLRVGRALVMRLRTWPHGGTWP